MRHSPPRGRRWLKGLLEAGIALLTLATLALTLAPSGAIPDSRLWAYDRLGHAMLLGSWTFTLGCYVLIVRRKEVGMLAIVAIGTAFGIAIEVLQELLPVDRQAQLGDAVADAIGCVVAALALKWLARRERRRRFALE